jgi:trehalose/maltose hydrolase-like predicted phosphorylase
MRHNPQRHLPRPTPPRTFNTYEINVGSRAVWLILLLAVLAGCARSPQTAAVHPAPEAPLDPWVLTTLDRDAATPALLWNGLMGVRLGRDAAAGEGALFLIDEYETEGEEKLRALDAPMAAQWTLGGERLSPARNYRQALDMKTGLLTTEWKQRLRGGEATVRVESVVHPEQRLIGQRWTLTPARPLAVELRIPMGQESEMAIVEGDPLRHESIGLIGPNQVQARARHIANQEGQWDREGDHLVWRAGETPEVVFERVLTLGMSPNGYKMAEARGVLSMGTIPTDAPPAPTFEALAGQTREIWAKRWETDIEIDGPVEDQQAVRSFMFYLWGSIHPNGQMAVSPLGLSGTTYFGHVFWDADLWVFPALALIAPERAAAIPNYRLAHRSQARENYLEWTRNGRPTGRGKVSDLAESTQGRPHPLKYPWESSVSGSETVPGPSRFQDHITGTVAFALGKAATLGLAPNEEADAVLNGAASFYIERAEPTERGLEIRGTMSPDEHHIGDNDLYTNLLAQWTHNGGRWTERADPTFHLPRDENSLITYDNDAFRGYKQAAAVLAIYPLQYPEAEEQARVMMERFEDKVTRNGPAMSDSVHALIWARLGERQRAYDTWRKSWQEFTQHPLLLFSEKRSRDVTYFTTGAGGCLQTVIYGFLGFRIDSQKEPGAAWTKKLEGDNWLSVKPNLPPTWNRVTFRNFSLLGERHTLTVTHDDVTVTQGDL